MKKYTKFQFAFRLNSSELDWILLLIFFSHLLDWNIQMNLWKCDEIIIEKYSWTMERAYDKTNNKVLYMAIFLSVRTWIDRKVSVTNAGISNIPKERKKTEATNTRAKRKERKPLYYRPIQVWFSTHAWMWLSLSHLLSSTLDSDLLMHTSGACVSMEKMLIARGQTTWQFRMSHAKLQLLIKCVWKCFSLALL